MNESDSLNNFLDEMNSYVRSEDFKINSAVKIEDSVLDESGGVWDVYFDFKNFSINVRKIDNGIRVMGYNDIDWRMKIRKHWGIKSPEIFASSFSRVKDIYYVVANKAYEDNKNRKCQGKIEERSKDEETLQERKKSKLMKQEKGMNKLLNWIS